MIEPPAAMSDWSCGACEVSLASCWAKSTMKPALLDRPAPGSPFSCHGPTLPGGGLVGGPGGRATSLCSWDAVTLPAGAAGNGPATSVQPWPGSLMNCVVGSRENFLHDAVGIAIELVAGQTIDIRVGAGEFEIAEHMVERPVLHHHHDDVVDLAQIAGNHRIADGDVERAAESAEVRDRRSPVAAELISRRRHIAGQDDVVRVGRGDAPGAGLRQGRRGGAGRVDVQPDREDRGVRRLSVDGPRGGTNQLAPRNDDGDQPSRQGLEAHAHRLVDVDRLRCGDRIRHRVLSGECCCYLRVLVVVHH